MADPRTHCFVSLDPAVLSPKNERWAECRLMPPGERGQDRVSVGLSSCSPPGSLPWLMHAVASEKGRKAEC